MTMFMTILRSAWTVLAGYLLLSILIMLLNIICMLAVPAWRDNVTGTYLAVNILLSILSAACGGWLTAHLVPCHRFQHGLALGLLATVFGILYAMGSQPEADIQQPPEWYRLLLASLALPSVLAGSMLRIRRAGR